MFPNLGGQVDNASFQAKDELEFGQLKFGRGSNLSVRIASIYLNLFYIDFIRKC